MRLVQVHIKSPCQDKVAVNPLPLYQLLGREHIRRLKSGKGRCIFRSVFLGVLEDIVIHIRLYMTA